MSRIGIVSDLHLDASNIKIEKGNWDTLVLAGDIATDFSLLHNFFSYNCPQDIPVIYVMGNHEFEGKDYDEAIEQLKETLKHYEHVHLLHNESIVVNGIKYIGTPLWSNFEGMGRSHKEEIKKWAQHNIVDFNYIYKRKGPYMGKFTPDDMEREFYKAYDFLNYELKKNLFDGAKIVVSHFAPSIHSLHPKYASNLGSAYWVNDLPHLMGFSDYWFHGHTHNSFNYEIEGTKVVCNPRGYSATYNLSENAAFNPLAYVEVEPRAVMAEKPKRAI